MAGGTRSSDGERVDNSTEGEERRRENERNRIKSRQREEDIVLAMR